MHATFFKDKARRDLLEYSEVLVTELGSHPESKTAAEFTTEYHRLKEDVPAMAEALVGLMTSSLQKAKYGRAVERITGEPACVHHACAYRDVAGAIGSVPDIDASDAAALYESIQDKETFWNIFDALSASAFCVAERSQPTVPTREEIRESINLKKISVEEGAPSGEQPSMLNAFAASLKNLAKDLGADGVYDDRDEAAMRSIMHLWAEAAKKTVNEERVSALCDKRVVAALLEYKAAVPELTFPSSVEKSTWTLVTELNTYSAVGDNIPVKMMSRIENIANQLADDLVSGNKDLNQMNLKDIGKQVLAGCDAGDMSQFANNIQDLLPALKGFQQNFT